MKIDLNTICLMFGILFSTAIYAQDNNKDLVYLNSGEIVSGTLVEIAYPRHVRLMVEDQYLEPFLFKDIDKIIQNQMYDDPFDVLYMVSGERTIGIILQINPNDFITFIPDHLGDTVCISHEKVKRIFHKKENIERKLNAVYKGDHHYFSISPGIEFAHGRIGLSFQYRVGGDFGVGMYVRGGFNLAFLFGPEPYYNVGLKLYFLNSFYINGGYGIIGHYEERIPPYTSIEDRRTASVEGFTARIGADHFFNKSFGLNIAMGREIPIEKETIDPKFLFDMGVIFKFPIRKHRNQSKKK
ncbi:hypothetical protein [Lentimicrobium sp. S6]|uniref:hypothetical protein n=1 Tax=Lentimicrobium sp. S6 TaxID=2735872 RepID=UPI001557FB1E|nr:hypothetical protein [Lentimicrobium sp. S6]NPD44588.1 hypothetical protein [Lentimicrobium sp. S6]